MSRSYPSHPVPGVGAVILDGDRVVLVRRGREPLKGFWSIPGGGLELGESLLDAVRREVREEVGLEIEVLGMVEIFERILRDGDQRVQYHYVLIDYLCEPAIGGGREETGEQIQDRQPRAAIDGAAMGTGDREIAGDGLGAGRVDAGLAPLRARDDAEEARWVPRKELPRFRLTEGTLAVIEKAFEMREQLRAKP